MRKLLSMAAIGALAMLIFAGCATITQANKVSASYMHKGSVSEKLKGNDFYMAIGETELLKYDWLGNLKPSGKTVEVAVVIQSDKETGEVLRIATLQPKVKGEPAVTDFREGISIIDLQP